LTSFFSRRVSVGGGGGGGSGRSSGSGAGGGGGEVLLDMEEDLQVCFVESDLL
jgi:hypothetical protein